MPGKVSRQFRSSVVVSHGLSLYHSVDRGNLLRGFVQSVPDTLCRHKAPNPFAGGFPSAWVIFVQIPVMARPRGSSCMPLCESGDGGGAIRQNSPRRICTDTVIRVGRSQLMPLCVFPIQPMEHLPGDSRAKHPGN